MANLEFRELVSRSVLGHPAEMVEECFEKYQSETKAYR